MIEDVLLQIKNFYTEVTKILLFFVNFCGRAPQGACGLKSVGEAAHGTVKSVGPRKGPVD